MPFTRSSWKLSLTSQLLATFVLAIALTAAVLLATVIGTLRWNMEGMTQSSTEHAAHELVSALQFDRSGQPVAVGLASDSAFLYRVLPGENKYRVLDAAGRTVLSSEPESQPMAPPALDFDPERARFEMPGAEAPLQVVTLATRHDGKTWYVQVASTQRMARLQRLGTGWSFLGPMLLTVVIGSVGCGLVGVLMLRRTLRPLSEASQAAAGIAPRNLAARLRTAGLPSELAQVFDAFNMALERLERGFRVQQEFLATAAHELKTPLALVRGQIEIGGAGHTDSLLKDVDLMARQVQQLLSLAEVSEAQNFIIERVDVGRVASETIAYLAPLAERQGVLLDLRMPRSAASVQGDGSALFVLLKNLVENAIQHSPQRGVVQVTVDDQGLSVRDDGGGIAPDHLPRLFDRFWRGPARRTDGAGLGLAICAEIAAGHGWALSASNAAGGAEFKVRFAVQAAHTGAPLTEPHPLRAQAAL